MKTQTKYIFFDVANTLLHKPDLYDNILSVFKKYGNAVEKNKLKYHHKLLSESTKFPDKTNAEFYSRFNSELLLSLGIIPDKIILDDIFSACTYLPWKAFDDTAALNKIKLPMGIISNWDNTLQNKLNEKVNISFFRIIGSEISGISKPDIRIFEKAFDGLDVPPNEIIFVGDSLKLDMAPAIQAGLNAYLIDRDNLFPNFPKRLNSLYQLTELINN